MKPNSTLSRTVGPLPMLPPLRISSRKTRTFATISAIVTTGVRSVGMLSLSGNTRRGRLPGVTTPTPRMPSFDLAALSADVSGLLDEALPALEAARRPLQLESVACLLCLPMRDPGVPRAAADVVASAVARRAEPAARELLGALAAIAPRQLAVAAADRLGATAAAGRRAPAIDAVRAMRDAQVDVVAWTCTADGQDF